MFLRKFKYGLMLGTTMSGIGDGGGGGGGGGGDNAAFLATLPETVRGHEAFKSIKDVGGLAQSYLDTQKPFAERLPEKIRGEAYFKDIKSFDDLATKAFNQAKMIGRDPNTLVQVPKDANDKDGWNSIYTTLGRPEAADKYVIPKRGEGKDYTAEEQAFHKAITPVLHEAGLSQRQLETIVPAWNKMVDAQNKQLTDNWDTNAAKAEEALRGEWGAAYDEKVDLANQAVKHFGSPELIAELNTASRDGKTLLGDSPHLTRMFAKLGEALKEDGLLGKGEGQGGGGNLSPAEANQQINALKADPQFVEAWTKKGHPGHADAVAKLQRLYAFANPTS